MVMAVSLGASRQAVPLPVACQIRLASEPDLTAVSEGAVELPPDSVAILEAVVGS
jgi:hypothetical protein